jgi:hypothetical protein
MAKQESNSAGTVIFFLGLVIAIASGLAFTPDGSAPQTMASLAFISNYTGADKDAFANGVVAMANSLGISANDIMFVMFKETAGTLSPAIQNHGNATGLIQFEADTATGLGTSIAALKAMTGTQQLQYVEKYLQQIINQYGSLDSTSDVYLAVFYPAALAQDNTYTFPADVVAQNPLFFKGTAATKQDFINWVKNNIPAGYEDVFTNI